MPFRSHWPEKSHRSASSYHTHCTTGEETIFSNICRVLPGEIVEIDAQLQLSRRQYWSALAITPNAVSQHDAEEALDSLFTQVVKGHCRSDVPYGLLLSGGNDSAILLALLTRFQEQPVRTFSVGYQPAAKRDELSVAEGMARKFGAEHTSLRLERAELFRRVPHHIRAADDLMRDDASLPTSALSELAGQEVKVVFCGEGGDEAFAGYRRYRKPRIEY